MSGTPIGKGKLQDLQGLFSFLQQTPVNTASNWMELIEKPINQGDSVGLARLHCLCRHLMLRRTKNGIDSSGQLCLPKQTVITKHLKFDAVEAHFYKQKYDECTQVVQKLQERSDTSNVDYAVEKEVEIISANLLALRQAACHPQLGARGKNGSKKGKQYRVLGGRLQITSSGMHVLTMDRILFKLIDEAKLRCEESQRKLLMNMAASAGVYQIQAELSSQNERAYWHFMSKARGTYSDAIQTYVDNRRPSLVLGTVIVSSLTKSSSPELFCVESHSTLQSENSQLESGVSYSCRANDVKVCWNGCRNPGKSDKANKVLGVSEIVSRSPHDIDVCDCLGYQLDNVVGTVSSTNRRILQVECRNDIEAAIQSLLCQKGKQYAQLLTFAKNYQFAMCKDALSPDAELVGIIYTPCDIDFESAFASSYINSHR